MASVSDVVALKREAEDAFDSVLGSATELRGRGILGERTFATLRARRGEIERLPVREAVTEMRLRWTLRTLRTAVDSMNAIAIALRDFRQGFRGYANADIAAAIEHDVNTFIGGATAVIGVIGLMAAPLYSCPREGCGMTSPTRSTCPVHPAETMR